MALVKGTVATACLPAPARPEPAPTGCSRGSLALRDWCLRTSRLQERKPYRVGTRFSAPTLALATAAFISAAALAADANESKFIRGGMGEGEFLLKIGKPDHAALIRVVRGEPELKSWSYLPHSRDRQTLTVVTFHAGVVTRVDRKIAR